MRILFAGLWLGVQVTVSSAVDDERRRMELASSAQLHARLTHAGVTTAFPASLEELRALALRHHVLPVDQSASMHVFSEHARAAHLPIYPVRDTKEGDEKPVDVQWLTQDIANRVVAITDVQGDGALIGAQAYAQPG